MAKFKTIRMPLDQNLKVLLDVGDDFKNTTMYKKIVDILVYLAISQ